MEKDDGGRQKQQPLLAKVGLFKSHFRDMTLPPSVVTVVLRFEKFPPLRKSKSEV